MWRGKNWAIVRIVVGYHRYDTPPELLLINRIWVLQSDARRDFSVAVTALKQLHAAGVTILACTDASNPGTAHGASIHHELELLWRPG